MKSEKSFKNTQLELIDKIISLKTEHDKPESYSMDQTSHNSTLMRTTAKKPRYVKKGGLLRKKVQHAKIDLDDSPAKTEFKANTQNIALAELHEVT